MATRLDQIKAYTSFGDFLKYLRKRAQMTQRELGIATGYSEAHISRMEQNQRNPDFDSLMPLFIPALRIDDEPETIAWLLELAAKPAAHRTPQPGQIPQPPVVADEPRTHPGQLPSQLTSFWGREAEIAAIQRLLRENQVRLVTLMGPGGVGKTRLAIRVAEACRLDYPDGIWFVDLTFMNQPDLLARYVSTALDLPANPGGNFEQLLLRFLWGKRTLIVLDNCEHVVEACARLADLLLRACPGLTILATSREGLNIGSEQLYQVPSLAVPDSQHLPPDELLGYAAVRLFVERAQAVQAAFRLTEVNAGAVTGICRRLDGIPLALELAAARVAMLSVEEIANRLDRSFHLLTGGSRVALPRHRTLNAAIQWSYDLLTAPERLLLRRLSVFSGSFTLEGTEQVCSSQELPGGDIVDVLASLVNKSMVAPIQQADRTTRFRLLETVRMFGLEQLAVLGEDIPLRDRHLDYYMALAEQAEPEIRGPNRWEWKRRLVAELENLRAAIQWALYERQYAEKGLRLVVSLSFRFLSMVGNRSILYEWLPTGLGLAEAQPIPDILRARAMFEMAFMVSHRYRVEDAELDQWFGGCVRLCQKIGRPADHIRAMALVFWARHIWKHSGNPQTERDRRLEAVQIARGLVHENPWFAGVTFIHAADGFLWEPSDYDLAYSLAEEGTRLMEPFGDPPIGKGYWMIAAIDGLRGNIDRAQTYLEECLYYLQDDLSGSIQTNYYLGWILIQKQAYPQVLGICRKVLLKYGFDGVSAAMVCLMAFISLVRSIEGCPPGAAREQLQQAAVLQGLIEREVKIYDFYLYVILYEAHHRRALEILRETLPAEDVREGYQTGARMTSNQILELIQSIPL